jgi:transposase InsO family protein
MSLVNAAYAIYYLFLKFEHLIRDIKFTVRTDHKNLTYLNNESNPKVKRWKIAIQEYDFDIEYIPGDKNVVADGFSRLLPITDEEVVCMMHEFTLNQRIYMMISKVHNSIAGHHGVERTLKKLNDQNNTWEYMREHVKRFIKQCPCCQKMSHIKIQIHTHPFTTATYEPMMRLNIDTINGLPPDEFGNRSLIVIKDCFSRWIEIFPTPNETASVAASALLQHVGRYGCPSQILSDNGPQYVNELIKEFTKLIGTEYITTLAYSKEENAIVERANKETLRHLKAIIFDKNVIEKWSKDTIPFVQRIINASVDKSIGVAPSHILYGNAINLDNGIFLPLPYIQNDITQNDTIKLSTWTDKMIKTQQAVINAAKQSQQTKDNKHISNANAKRSEFLPESYVLIQYPTSNMKPGPPNKMMANLKGPMQVINNIGNTYTVRNLLTGKHEKYHITQLRTFNYEPQNTDPLNIAIKDQQEHVIEAILDHSGEKQNKTEMDFLVRWKGESDENNLWMPWKDVRRNPILHQYLRDNKMKSIIPNEFK